MPIDWDNFDKASSEAIDQSAKESDAALAAKISALTKMSDEEINALFPKTEDQEKLLELMTIVNSATDRNEKVNAIVANGEKFGGIVLTLLSKYV